MLSHESGHESTPSLAQAPRPIITQQQLKDVKIRNYSCPRMAVNKKEKLAKRDIMSEFSRTHETIQILDKTIFSFLS
jgi:hypothetical protein